MISGPWFMAHSLGWAIDRIDSNSEKNSIDIRQSRPLAAGRPRTHTKSREHGISPAKLTGPKTGPFFTRTV